jgi:integrase
MARPRDTRNLVLLPSGRWQCKIKRNGRVEKESFRYYEQARDYRDAIQLDRKLVERGLPGLIRHRPRLLEVLRAYVEAACERTTDRTSTGYAIELRPVELYLRDELRRPDLLAEEWSDATTKSFTAWRLRTDIRRWGPKRPSLVQVRRNLVQLRRAYAHAGLTPAWAMPRMPRDTGGKRIPPLSEVQALRAELPEGELARTVLELLLRTGLRTIDARRLRWSDLDLEAGWVSFTASKTSRAHRVPISPELLRYLRLWRDNSARVPTVAGWLFTLEGRPLLESSLRSQLRTASKRAGITPAIEYLGWCRNLFCALGLAVDPYATTRAVDHKDTRTTLGYAQRADVGPLLQGLVQQVDHALDGPAGGERASKSGGGSHA